jgi:hypothetical protein
MKTEDIEMLERIAARHKYRYEILDSCFDKTIANTIIYVPINVTLVLAEINQFKDSLIDTKDFPLHAGIAIANLFAHYKHYYTTKGAEGVIIIGFVKDGFFYKEYHGIITVIENICDFFPRVYFMNNYAAIKHAILAGGLLSHIHSFTIAQQKSSIHVYSSFNADKQLMCLFPAKEAYKICKPMNSQRVEFLSKRQFIKKIFKDNDEAYEKVYMYKAEIERLCVVLGIYFGTYECYSASEKKKFTFVFARDTIKNKVKHFHNFLENHFSKDDPDANINGQFVQYLKHYLYNAVCFESFKMYINRYDYFSHQGKYMHDIMRHIYGSLKVKLKDYEMSKEAEKYRLFIQHPLYANWLM